MKILLDECCHRRIKRALRGYDVATVQSAGWAGLKNGELMKRVGDRYGAFVTQDQRIPQQNVIAGCSFGVLVLATRAGRWHELEPLMPKLRDALDRVRPVTVSIIRA